MIMSSMASNEIVKEIVNVICDCILAEDNENQRNRLDKMLDLLNMLVKAK